MFICAHNIIWSCSPSHSLPLILPLLPYHISLPTSSICSLCLNTHWVLVLYGSWYWNMDSISRASSLEASSPNSHQWLIASQTRAGTSQALLPAKLGLGWLGLMQELGCIVTFSKQNLLSCFSSAGFLPCFLPPLCLPNPNIHVQWNL